MTLLSFQFNFHFDFSGLLCIFVSMFCIAIGAIGWIIGMFMRSYYKEMNPRRLPLSRAVIYGSMIPLIGAGLTLLSIGLSNMSGGETSRTFREGMDAMSIPAALISLAIPIYNIYQKAASVKEFPTVVPEKDGDILV